jgi:hypothetical protein
MRKGCSGDVGAAEGGGFLSNREAVSAGTSVLLGGDERLRRWSSLRERWLDVVRVVDGDDENAKASLNVW